MQQNEINLNQMVCLNPNHQMKEIFFLCLNSTCNNESRLVCMDCYPQHPHHRMLENRLLSEDIQKNISTESPLAKETLLLFQQLKGKIIGLLNQIEQELVGVCQMRIPNDAAEELLNFLKYPQFDRNYLNFKVENYLKTTTGDQLYRQNNQRNLSTSQLEKYSSQITSYIVKINNWLLKMPQIQFKPQTQQALQKKFSEDFGNPYYNQLKQEKYLIQQFSVKQPTRLNQIKHGRIEGFNDQQIQFHFYMGTQLDCPFYKYSVRIQQMVIAQSAPNEFITKFDPPIYLYPKVKYCISISSQHEFRILDFTQKPLDNQNQNFSLHILSQINELVFKQRYFVTEFIYDIMEIQ